MDSLSSAGAHIGMFSDRAALLKDPVTVKIVALNLRMQLIVKCNSIKAKLHRSQR